jgi:hypothetical protein
MAKTTSKPALTPVSTGVAPPRRLGADGTDLWVRVMSEYLITDSGGLEILSQICTALDRAEQLAVAIAEDGAVIRTENGLRSHPAIKDELALRAFIARTLERLGLNIQTVRPVGRPPTSKGWSPS